MPVTALLLLFASATLHALWNLLLKRAEEKYIAMGWMVLLGDMRVLGSAVIFAGILTIALFG